MDQRILSVCLLVVLCSMIAEHQCDDKISIEEGTTTSLSCTVPIKEDKWYVAWVIQRNKWKLITVCNKNSRLEKCIHENETLQDKNKILTRYNAQTYIEKGSFISNLTVLNVTAKMRKMVICCITSETNDFDSNVISVIESYTLNVYNLPERKSCQASKDKDNVIEVSCRFLKVYPEISCNVFPELVSRINSDVSDSHSAIKQECKVKHYDYTIAGKPYYKASCTTKYYPKKNGSYRFHVEVHVPGSPVNLTNITTNEVTVGYTNEKQMALEATEMDLKETNKAFYTLTAAFMIFGATGVVVIGWVIWSRRCISCSSASATDVGPSNEYESIQYGDGGLPAQDAIQLDLLGERSGNRLVVYSQSSDPQTEDTISTQGLLQQAYNNLALLVSRPNLRKARSSGPNSSYIVPCTPASSQSGDSENNSSLDTFFDDGNYTTNMSTFDCEETDIST